MRRSGGRGLRLLAPIGVVLMLLVAVVPSAQPLRAAPAPRPASACGIVPLGAVPPAEPIWCLARGAGPVTFQQGPNAWLDDWNHGLSNADLGPGYVTFQQGSVHRTEHWRHADHWMVDVAGIDDDNPPPWDLGGAMMRPDRSFRFENGKLVIEADVAAGIQEYGGNAWPELVVTTAPAPTGVVDDLYAYGVFKGHWTVGCRLQPSRDPVCAMYDSTGRGAGAGGRTFEISHFQHEGTARVFAGGPFDQTLDAAWRRCAGMDPDLNCRDRFRWELTRDSLTIYVNGVKYMEHAGLPPGKQLPDALVNGPVYVYFASWVYKSGVPTVRFHWDRTAVNPDALAPALGVPDEASVMPVHAHHDETPAPVEAPAEAPVAPPCEVEVYERGVLTWSHPEGCVPQVKGT